MTDKELLEMAAKAAGYVITEAKTRLSKEPYLAIRYNNAGDTSFWNPLTNDGDAFRLAVKLMMFEPYKSRGYLPCITKSVDETRRAIVRTAAEIGKTL